MSFVPSLYPNVKKHHKNFQFDSQTVQNLLEFCQKKIYKKGDYVFTPKDKADKMYYVIKGSLSVLSENGNVASIDQNNKNNKNNKNNENFSDSVRNDNDPNQLELFFVSPLELFEHSSPDVLEKNFVLNHIQEHEFVGEMGLFYPSIGRQVFLRADVTTEIAEISYDRFFLLLSNELKEDSSKILFEIGRQLSKRLLSVGRKSMNLAFFDIKERVMRSIIELAEQKEALSHPLGMQIKVSRQDLGKLSGCSRELAGKALKELEEEKRLHAHGKTIVVYGQRY